MTILFIVRNNEPEGKPLMEEILFLLLVIAIWIFLQAYALPKMGIST